VGGFLRATCLVVTLLTVQSAARAEEVPLPQPWAYADAMKVAAAKGKLRPGVVLHVGDSITYASPYAAWARAGEGRTESDRAALKWMHAGANDDADGWYLATFDHPDGGRSHTACGGIRSDEMLAGGTLMLLIATARGEDCDFVSRFFAPAKGVPEDPVTGSAHCTLAAWWAPRLGRVSLLGEQASPRGGRVQMTLRDDRVGLAGQGVTVLHGELTV